MIFSKTFLLALALGSVSLGARAQSFTLLLDQPEQTIDGFGASDAWSMNRIGLWSDSIQQQTADWLFSLKDDDQGQPLGIGLSIWRFNLGAGSSEQGDSSNINLLTRTECLMRKDGTWDWSRQKGQRRFLQLAKERGVPHFVAFLNSPAVYFTQNGWATNTGRGGTFNLRPDCYEAQAAYIAAAIDSIGRHDGVTIDYVSPVNEPDGSWNWLGPKQEGSPATDREIARLVRPLSRALTDRHLSTVITIPEAYDYRCLYEAHESGAERGFHLQHFFTPDSVDTYVGNLSNVARLLCSHSYWTNTPVDSMRSIRHRVYSMLRPRNVDLWQSEVCIMGNDTEIGGGGGYDFTMKTALYVARMIHHDLVYANARSWQWWRAAGADYKDGLLREYGGDDGSEGAVRSSKLLWALGNYSRFVRPGAVRLNIVAAERLRQTGDRHLNYCDAATDPTGLMVSAYRNAGGQLVVVAINYAQEAKNMKLILKGAMQKWQDVKRWKMYRTSDNNDEHITPVGTVRTGKNVEIPGRSIVTFTAE